MPGSTDQLIATETTRVRDQALTIGNDAHLAGGKANRHHFASMANRYAVAIAIHPYQTDAGDPQNLFDVTVEHCRHRAQQRLFFGKHLANAAAGFRMFAAAQFPAAHSQPGIKRRQIGKPR